MRRFHSSCHKCSVEQTVISEALLIVLQEEVIQNQFHHRILKFLIEIVHQMFLQQILLHDQMESRRMIQLCRNRSGCLKEYSIVTDRMILLHNEVFLYYFRTQMKQILDGLIQKIIQILLIKIHICGMTEMIHQVIISQRILREWLFNIQLAELNKHELSAE